MGVEEAWKHVLEHVERSTEHQDRHERGERTVGVGDEVADLHSIFDPLTAEELEEEVGRAIPGELATFSTRCANGVILFAEEPSIYGVRVEVRAQPWDLGMHAAEAPPGAEDHPDIDPWVWESAVGFDADEDDGG